jgi:hypothetical protein
VEEVAYHRHSLVVVENTLVVKQLLAFVHNLILELVVEQAKQKIPKIIIQTKNKKTNEKKHKSWKIRENILWNCILQVAQVVHNYLVVALVLLNHIVVEIVVVDNYSFVELVGNWRFVVDNWLVLLDLEELHNLHLALNL